MNKVAVFGNAGAGKSTTSRQVAKLTGLPLHVLDKVKFRAGGEEIPHPQYLAIHEQILDQPQWIIDGFGCLESTWLRLAAADTLIYIDLPIHQHYWWVTKRFIKGLFIPPEGWPDNTPLLKGTLNSYRVLWLCHTKLTPAYRRFVTKAAEAKTVYHLRSKAQINEFITTLKRENEK